MNQQMTIGVLAFGLDARINAQFAIVHCADPQRNTCR